MMLAFEVYPKRKFCVVIAWLKENLKCLPESVICEMNTKKEVIEKKKVNYYAIGDISFSVHNHNLLLQLLPHYFLSPYNPYPHSWNNQILFSFSVPDIIYFPPLALFHFSEIAIRHNHSRKI